jgi:DNA repair photolyase
MDPQPAAGRGRGRGASYNPPNRFEAAHREPEEDWDPAWDSRPTTQFLTDASQSIITRNDSPDIPFNCSLNPYRGCEHGCIYCYARPTHEFLGFSSGLDFETRILVKENAPALLRARLESPHWRPEPLAMCGVTDPYQPAERRLRITRRCLEVLAAFRNPVMIATKNHLVTRDIDLLTELARHQAASVAISLSSLDTGLVRQLEPRTSPPAHRLAAMEQLAAAGIPVTVLVAPVIPALNLHEMLAVMAAAAQAGATGAHYEILRLPHSVSSLFLDWLDRHHPGKKSAVLAGLRSLRDGRLNDGRFGSRMNGEGFLASQISQLFAVQCHRLGFNQSPAELSTAAFRRPAGTQLELEL